MAYFDWTPDLETGVERMDMEHRKLVDMLNELFEAMMNLKGRAARDKVIMDLIEYTRTHFATEEEYMSRYSYPEFEAHKRKHDGFALKVRGIEIQLKNGEDVPTSDVSRLMREWLRDHILYTDKKLGEYLTSLKTG
ncbi:MAG: bacteriohemerythrin [Desulfatibacillaceae bacterium]